MKLKFLAKSVGHVCCVGVNLDKDQIGEFEDSVGQNLLASMPRDFELVSVEKNRAPEKNKMAKKTVKYKSK